MAEQVGGIWRDRRGIRRRRFRLEHARRGAQKLWKARHDAYFAVKALKPGVNMLATDVCVPISRLADCVMETKADLAATRT